MRVIATWFRFLFVLAAINLASVGVFGQQSPNLSSGSEQIEKSLANQYYYSIPGSMRALEWLETLISILEQDRIKNPQYADKTQLQLGDAYHWIGHIYEDRGQLELAWAAQNKAYEHYLLSNIKSSPAINNLLTAAHARFHLVRLAEKLNRPLPMGLIKDPQLREKKIPTLAEMKNYRQDVEMAWDRLSPSTRPKICKRYFLQIFSAQVFLK